MQRTDLGNMQSFLEHCALASKWRNPLCALKAKECPISLSFFNHQLVSIAKMLLCFYFLNVREKEKKYFNFILLFLYLVLLISSYKHTKLF